MVTEYKNLSMLAPACEAMLSIFWTKIRVWWIKNVLDNDKYTKAIKIRAKGCNYF